MEEQKKYKKSMKNCFRDLEKKMKIYKDKVSRVRYAIEKMNIVQRKEICKAAEIKMHDLKNIFHRERDLYAEYCVRRKVITDMATDNIYRIVSDDNHPKNYDASKWVAQNFKTELDDMLESRDEESMGLNVNSDENGGITIKFGNKKEKGDE
jgi:hypothetical protein